MTGPGQPRTCSHPINARILTGVGQDDCSMYQCTGQDTSIYLIISNVNVNLSLIFCYDLIPVISI